MKNICFILISGLLLCLQSMAQAPQKFNYQGIARNGSGQPLASQAIGLKISILDGSPTGTAQYVETHTATTNAYGLYHIAVGGGTIVSGTMAAVTWNLGDKYVKVEMDPAGGTSYTLLGTSQLLSVPFALNALGPATRVTAAQPPGCQTLASVTTTMTKIADLCTFNKVLAGTYIEVNMQTILSTLTFTTATGVVYEIRIDNNATTIGNATHLVRVANTAYPVNITGVFTGLAAGPHAISIWAKGVNGTAANAYYDPGCFNSFGTNNILIKEYQ